MRSLTKIVAVVSACASLVAIATIPFIVEDYKNLFSSAPNTATFSEKDSAALALQARQISASSEGWLIAARRQDDVAASALKKLGIEFADSDACHAANTASVDALRFLELHTIDFTALICDGRTPLDRHIYGQLSFDLQRALNLNLGVNYFIDSLEKETSGNSYSGGSSNISESERARFQFFAQLGMETPWMDEQNSKIEELSDQLKVLHPRTEDVYQEYYDICIANADSETPERTYIFKDVYAEPLPVLFFYDNRSQSLVKIFTENSSCSYQRSHGWRMPCSKQTREERIAECKQRSTRNASKLNAIHLFPSYIEELLSELSQPSN